jgi:hypothetical protein
MIQTGLCFDQACRALCRGDAQSIAAATAATIVSTTAAAAIAAATAAATTTAVTASATTTAATAAGTRLTRPGFVDRQSAAIVILIVQIPDCLLGLGVGVHLDESESLATPCVTVGDDLGTLNGAELRKELLKIRIIDLVGQVPDVQFLAHHQAPERKPDDPLLAFRVERKGAE